MRKFLAEAIGTYALVFAGTGAIVVDYVSGGTVTHVGVAMTWGLIVMALVYALGEISGAHLNPAVTFSFCIARQFPLRCGAGYVLAQLAGALAASGTLRLLFGNVARLGGTLPAGSAGQSFGLEVLLTALLVLVILCVSTGPKETGIMAGIAVGGVVGLEALFAGPICGASMNPARSIGPAVVSGDLHLLWIYVLAPLAGALVGIAAFAVIRRRA